MHIVEGGVVAPKGFKSGGKFIGLKKKRKDLSIVLSEIPCSFAALFTTNKVKAAPVIWNQEIYNNYSKIRALVINSGNANACTGQKGYEDTVLTAKTLAKSIGADQHEILVASTGVIGVPLPIDKITNNIDGLVQELDDDVVSGINAAEGIMTTDTNIKMISVKIEIEGKEIHIGGMAKGSGMIHPNMATMLSFITTDINIDESLLRDTLKEITKDTYNMISVDGDTSTNDMVIALANGMAGNAQIISRDENYKIFYDAFLYVNKYLAQEIVRDGEGASKFIEVNVNGAKSKEDAILIVKSVLTSNLVKTALFGEDANWGRVLCAAGYSGADFNPDKATLYFESNNESILLLEQGLPVTFDEDKAFNILKNNDITIRIELEEGEGSSTGWGCDLSYEYVKINGEYRT
ncbi:bifunctional ornithine acetyltransferase/N-acetylglutamate synthase [Alkalibaculum sp. M08DMB]|uniref:Arginine biosynthesis bifunctional protein ArgJ n=2 Tax=Alkalibaculum sporogenes TaxID=2655001 RepID=A0A6A7KB62_9FIRM|nr:bifunctional ornithine acetyltransferase/N-acetylglutamate synthase [Alkalibaculum sporogenes]